LQERLVNFYIDHSTMREICRKGGRKESYFSGGREKGVDETKVSSHVLLTEGKSSLEGGKRVKVDTRGRDFHNETI